MLLSIPTYILNGTKAMLFVRRYFSFLFAIPENMALVRFSELSDAHSIDSSDAEVLRILMICGLRLKGMFDPIGLVMSSEVAFLFVYRVIECSSQPMVALFLFGEQCF